MVEDAHNALVDVGLITPILVLHLIFNYLYPYIIYSYNDNRKMDIYVFSNIYSIFS